MAIFLHCYLVKRHPADQGRSQNHEYIIIKRWVDQHDQDKLFEHTRRLREVATVESKRDETRCAQPLRVFAPRPKPPLETLYGSQQALAPTPMYLLEKFKSPSRSISFSDLDKYDSDESDEEAISEDLNEEEAARAVEELLGKYTTLFQQPQHAGEGQHVEQASTAAGADEKSQESPQH